MLNSCLVFENHQSSSNFDSLRGAYVQYDYTFMRIVSTHFGPKYIFWILSHFFKQFLQNTKTQISGKLLRIFTVHHKHHQVCSVYLLCVGELSWATPATQKIFLGGFAPQTPLLFESVHHHKPGKCFSQTTMCCFSSSMRTAFHGRNTFPSFLAKCPFPSRKCLHLMLCWLKCDPNTAVEVNASLM
jgi:hypothetical protein